MAEQKAIKQRNQVFVYLYALAIIMVIDDHCASRIGILTSIFPYNSFYMPLFVFVSGYFFKDTPIFSTVKHKVKKLYIPFLLYSIFFMFVAKVIDKSVGTNWSNIDFHHISWKDTLVRGLLEFPISDLNGASWYVAMIFWVSIFYLILRKIVRPGKAQDYILTVILIAGGFFGVWLSMQMEVENIYYRFPSKMLFFMQFYHLGYMFHHYFEAMLQKCRKLYICLACVMINVIMLLTHDTIEYYATAHMTGFYNVYMPFVTSVSGILFYYEVADFLAKAFGEVKMVSFIGRNTFIIMQVHLFFVNLPNIYVYEKIKSGSTAYSDFPIEEFISSPWVRYYNKHTMLWGFCLGLICSLLIAYAWERIKERYSLRKETQ